MSDKAKSFGTGAILSALIIFMFTGIFGWYGTQVISIPSMKTELIYIKGGIDGLNKSFSNLSKEIAENEKLLNNQMLDMVKTTTQNKDAVDRLKIDCNNFQEERGCHL